MVAQLRQQVQSQRGKTEDSNAAGSNASPPAAAADFKSTVAHLTGDELAGRRTSGQPMMVMYYASWCSHCQEMKPDYARVRMLAPFAYLNACMHLHLIPIQSACARVSVAPMRVYDDACV